MSDTANRFSLPDDLPVPVDDGACDHLPGSPLPAVALPSTRGRDVTLAGLGGTNVVFAYPRTGGPDGGTPPGWDAIPGARGCTPETCAFRDHNAEFEALGVGVFGLSTQTTDYQREMVGRLEVPFEVLSDHDLRFASALRLPTFDFDGDTLVKRLTLVTTDGVIEHVFYPIFPPDAHASEVLAWMRDR